VFASVAPTGRIEEVTVGSVALGQVASLEAQKLYAKRLQVPATLERIAR